MAATAIDTADVARAEARAALRSAILLTFAYADVFDYPLDRAEVHRYLIGRAASRASVDEMLDADDALRASVERTGEWFHLSGRARIVRTRRERARSSARIRSVTHPYVAAIAKLPLVRFVAVTGALAMDNSEPGNDIDLFVLARPGRLWTARLLVLAVVRVAALGGHRVCPNFLLSTDALALRERNLFTAHEVAQMIPVERTRWFDAFRAANRWTDDFLPNANDGRDGPVRPSEPLLSRIASSLLASRVFDRLERWEMDRKIRRLEERARQEGGSVAFSKDECRGHFAAHDVRVLAAFAARAAELTA